MTAPAHTLSPDLLWSPAGHATLRGPLLGLARGLDGLFRRWAARCEAAEYRFPPFLPVDVLARMDYFRSFPQLVTFPAALEADPANLAAFAGQCRPAMERVELARCAPVREALTPAACYHLYPCFQGAELDRPVFLTTRCTCFRREDHYVPLERQWSFAMREIVCLGTAGEVRSFLVRYQNLLEAFMGTIGLPVTFIQATDPFFNPNRNPKVLAQRLDPLKIEMVFQDRLALGSFNYHRNCFGEAFAMRRGADSAHSGCVAFGLERWIAAILIHYGPEEGAWPAQFREPEHG